MERTWAKQWLIVFGVWTALVVIFTTHSYLYSSARGEPVRWLQVLLWAMSEWYTWAALTPCVVWLARKYPVDGPGRRKTVLIHLAGAVIFSILHVVLQDILRSFGASFGIGGGIRPRPLSELITQGLSVEFHIDFATYAVILACSHAVEYYRRFREREMKSAQLEAALANAQLDALRMQINPHFLFNTLNSISALVDEDRKAAQKMLARLGDFLRLTLKNPGHQAASLEQELHFLQSYLQIEQVRFGDRLKVCIDIEPEALEAIVPSLILQPIVENAFRHAIAKVDVGSLDIHGRRRGNTLELTVSDNGPGLPLTSSPNGGLGLANTRARLKTQYGTAQSLLLRNAPAGGLVVTITIPFESRRHGPEPGVDKVIGA